MYCGLILALLWALPLAAQLLSPGELAGPHAELEGLSQCTKCHALGKKVDEGRCLDCHKALAERIRAGKGYHANLKKACIDCHSDHRGRQYQMIRWTPEQFDHAQAGYALEEAHSRLRCAQCHKERSYLGLSPACLPCHTDQHQGQLSADCLGCHTMAAWKPAARFDHARSAYPLQGRHAQVACAKCHLEGKYKGLPFQQCRDCHQDAHRPSLGNDCQRCHTVAGWKEASQGFDHERTGYPLRGRHAQVACAKCHLEGKFKGLPFQQCRGCHQDYHQGQFSQDCADCHAVEAWKPAARFDHGRSVFPLQGKHLQVECAKCHPQGRYRPLPQQCRDCHQDIHQGQFAQDCALCHGAGDWKPATLFDHQRAAYQLDGAHARVLCEQCHLLEQSAEGKEFRRYRPLAATCQACHG